VFADFAAAVRVPGGRSWRIGWPWLGPNNHGAGNRRGHGVTIATRAGLALAKPVLHDIAALAAHGFVVQP
jgi:hypothetical protein